MKSLFEYQLKDWLRLRPLSHWMKTARYRAIDRWYVSRRARDGSPAGARSAIRGRKVITTVAFSDPQAIEWQAALLAKYVPHALHLILDNSPDEGPSAAICDIADRRGLLYLRLPANPWQSPSRSHGLALNWVWRNIILPGEPEAFGFLDDDLFPTAPDDPFAHLDDQNFYGLVRTAGPRWFLWAGFCFYRFDAVRMVPLDFGQDWFVGLDTGGGNWNSLYKYVARESIAEAPTEWIPFEPGVDLADGPLQWCGSWIHEVGVMGRPEFAARKREVVAGMLAAHLGPTGEETGGGDSATPQRPARPEAAPRE